MTTSTSNACQEHLLTFSGEHSERNCSYEKLILSNSRNGSQTAVVEGTIVIEVPMNKVEMCEQQDGIMLCPHYSKVAGHIAENCIIMLRISSCRDITNAFKSDKDEPKLLQFLQVKFILALFFIVLTSVMVSSHMLGVTRNL
ncbi:unnamed protein product, partial [Callosobruchus maculatus]